ncbi:unnamed protein product [Acanthoscelides obtectus]|uniref:Uncharacterized protein n=1 Tax=Acanthoscelides obtectus TaxID=200917 RepID=A0A9P0VTF5_ACAOB|nr:unnamed protein product [Acanthoscelides obtectus]CAK1687636.1 hypothetical protein AOBTE_LOCUS36306 [Acanthoscelides obtectus]
MKWLEELEQEEGADEWSKSDSEDEDIDQEPDDVQEEQGLIESETDMSEVQGEVLDEGIRSEPYYTGKDGQTIWSKIAPATRTRVHNIVSKSLVLLDMQER